MSEDDEHALDIGGGVDKGRQVIRLLVLLVQFDTNPMAFTTNSSLSVLMTVCRLSSPDQFVFEGPKRARLSKQYNARCVTPECTWMEARSAGTCIHDPVGRRLRGSEFGKTWAGRYTGHENASGLCNCRI